MTYYVYLCSIKSRQPMKQEQDQPRVSLEDYIVPAKIRAFVEEYTPAATEAEAEEVMGDAALRTFFQAYPLGIGDPLTLYIDALERNGYQLRVTSSNEPALLLRHKSRMEQSSRILEAAFGLSDEPSDDTQP